ncbi:fasciclin domain-containing protein [Roseibacterium sp. SDUM158017]|nr:fasciclin domain-containing protein [Roseibacterium sp. SDUM158017]MDG4649393.1 fasciclin domain-containing protein [Roseibacterium sp. SDUM158017]
MTLAATTALSAPAFADSHGMNIVETAVGAGNFTTLVAAVEAAGLVETLSGEGPFTVFAPTDEAFAALPEGTVEGLLEDPEALAAVLTYHVVPGAVMSGDLSDGMTATTVNGADVTISIDMGTVMVNEATVTAADIEATNGVIHVIDSVILPPM